MKFQVHPKLKGENHLVLLLLYCLFWVLLIFGFVGVFWGDGSWLLCFVRSDVLVWLPAFTHKQIYSSNGLVG